MSNKNGEKNKYFYGDPDKQGTPEQAIGIFAAHESLHSERTSSLPLVQFWCTKKNAKELRSRLASFNECSDIDIDISDEGCRLYFEYPVPSRDGKGKASMTDLMILTQTHAIAVEAKYTEVMEKYETIGEWLKVGEKHNSLNNRKDVLQGWWAYIREIKCTTAESIEQLSDYESIPYQLLHRIASACYTAKEKGKMAAVIYQIFYDDSTERKAKKFANNLQDCFGRFSLDEEMIHFKIVFTKVTPPCNNILGKLPEIVKDGKSVKDYNELFIMMLNNKNAYLFDECFEWNSTDRIGLS